MERWTIVTGASSGIGAALAREAAARSRSLVLVARRAERLDAVREEIVRAHPVTVETIALDLGTREAADALVDALATRGITPHTLINNAGFGLGGRFASLSDAEQAAMLQLNVVSLTRLCRLVLPGLMARGAGGIVNVASTAAFQPIPTMAVYAATKAYVLSFSEALHEEARRSGVVVTALCPGPTETGFAARAGMDGSRLFRNAMTPDAVARFALDAHARGDAVAIPGAANRAGAFFVGLAPRAAVRRAAGWLTR